MRFELVVAGLVFPALMECLRQGLGGCGLRVGDCGDQRDQLAGAVTVAVGNGVGRPLHPGESGALPADLASPAGTRRLPTAGP